MHWVNHYQHRYRAASNIDGGSGYGHRQFRGYKGSDKGGGKGNRGGHRRPDHEHRRNDDHGDGHGRNDVGEVAGRDHRTADAAPDRRLRDHHDSESDRER